MGAGGCAFPSGPCCCADDAYAGRGKAQWCAGTASFHAGSRARDSSGEVPRLLHRSSPVDSVLSGCACSFVALLRLQVRSCVRELFACVSRVGAPGGALVRDWHGLLGVQHACGPCVRGVCVCVRGHPVCAPPRGTCVASRLPLFGADVHSGDACVRHGDGTSFVLCRGLVPHLDWLRAALCVQADSVPALQAPRLPCRQDFLVHRRGARCGVCGSCDGPCEAPGCVGGCHAVGLRLIRLPSSLLSPGQHARRPACRLLHAKKEPRLSLRVPSDARDAQCRESRRRRRGADRVRGSAVGPCAVVEAYAGGG